jgi:predicted RNA-binding protein associated with RNAse of E/G family
MKKEATIIKLDHQGTEVTRYPGEVLMFTKSKIVLKTHFMFEDLDIHGITLRKGDRFQETYYFHKWYNIFEIHDREDDGLKGWYCNVGYPAEINGNIVSYRDLALDLLVFPDGRQIMMDEDEFEILPIPISDKESALSALRELQEKFNRKRTGQPSFGVGKILETDS